jgi:cell division protein ZapA
MSEVTLKIEIAGKEYPLKVTKDNADFIEEASLVIKNNLSEFEKKYSITDKKDILAMVFLQTVSEFLKERQNKQNELASLKTLLDELGDMVKQHQQKVI